MKTDLMIRRSIDQAILDGYWYYSVELEEGRFTSGMLFGNVALTRGLLKRAELKNRRCLDLGTMEGVIPTLMAKAGASDVIAMDAMNNSPKVDLLKALHDVSFQYQPNIRIDDIVVFLKNKVRLDATERQVEDWRVDVTVASGLLYHVNAPLPLIAHLRSATRAGGIVILETAALQRPEYDMRYGFDGKRYIYGWSDTWFPSVPLLDHLLRTCRLRPLDVVYLDQSDVYPDLVRLAVVCRSELDVIDGPDEPRMAQSAANVDFHIAVDLESDWGAAEVPLTDGANRPVMREATNSCDLFATIASKPGEQPAPDEIRLRLDARH